MSPHYICVLFMVVAITEVTHGYLVKGPKNVPRIGRSFTTQNDYVLNAPKNIPRMGRRNYDMGNAGYPYELPTQPESPMELQTTYDEGISKQDAEKMLEVLANALEQP